MNQTHESDRFTVSLKSQCFFDSSAKEVKHLITSILTELHRPIHIYCRVVANEVEIITELSADNARDYE